MIIKKPQVVGANKIYLETAVEDSKRNFIIGCSQAESIIQACGIVCTCTKKINVAKEN